MLHSGNLQAQRFSALRHRQFLRFWLGSFTSVGATQMQVMGLGWLVYELSGSSLALGYLGAAAGFPAIVTTLFGGALADRLDRRLLLMVTSLLTALLLALLAGIDYMEVVKVWHVIAIAGAISVITGFDWPTRQSIFPALIERQDMMSAVALTSIIWQATRMVIPALGGVIIAVSGTPLLFALCSAGFLFMFFVLLTMRVRPTVVTVWKSTFHHIGEGVRYILTHRTFFVLIGLSYTLMFFASSYMQLMPAFVDLLGTDEQGYGYLLSITGVGAVTGTLLSGSLQNSHRLGAAMLMAALVFCGFIYAFALISWAGRPLAFHLALGTLFAASVFSSIFMVSSTTVLQLEVPDRLRGRVMGFHAITYNLLPLGALFVGAIANETNPALAVAISTSIFVALLLWVIFSQAGIRRIDGRRLIEKTA